MRYIGSRLSRRAFILGTGALAAGLGSVRVQQQAHGAAQRDPRDLNTFSIAAYDAESAAWGIAVASKVLACGAVVPWARADAGAVATQARANISFGPDGLRMLESGHSAQTVLDTLVQSDEGAAERQVGIVDRQGQVAVYTGESTIDWAGHVTGEAFTCQGNILIGPNVLDAMAEAYSGASGAFADRLLAALKAGEDAGGDSRGKQSAAIYIAKQNDSFYGPTDRYMDLRVDDDDVPVDKLFHLRQLHAELFNT